jgi:two-component system chemotaxis response regulator CheY
MPSSASDPEELLKIASIRLSERQPFAATTGCRLEWVVSDKRYEKLIERLGLLVVDPNQYMRKLTRMMLMNIGAKAIYEAADGLAALDVVRAVNPDVMLLDWEVPVLSGPQIMHIVRSPGLFAKPFLPIVMLTTRASRSHVNEAMRLGVNEVLAKPTSPKMLRDRLLSILVKPRPMVQIGKYLVPEPRRPSGVGELLQAS